MSKILLIDDEESIREVMSIFFRRKGHQVETASNGQEGINLIKEQEFDVIFTDLKMPGNIDGLDVLRTARSLAPSTQVIMMTAFSSTQTVIEAMKLGAYHYIEKPFKLEEIEVLLDKCLEKRNLLQENVQLRSELQTRYHFGKLIAKSQVMLDLFEKLKKLAESKVNVLILGENGTGKELVARALHYNGPRKMKHFEAVNCAAIPESLWESEFFGHEKGAFTGAHKKQLGRFRAADGGTLFLDEIGDTPLQMQVKLLRALQERSIRPVGGTTDIPIDVRIIAATNKSLEEEVKAGRFRKDLFFRLNVFSIEIPPLRTRKEDIPVLAQQFLKEASSEMQHQITKIAPETMKLLLNYNYPGNVRELKNAIEYAILMETEDTLQPKSLPPAFHTANPLTPNAQLPPQLELPEEGMEEFLQKIERELLIKALEKAGGVRKEAAKLLKISFRSFRYRLSKHEDIPFSDKS